MQINKTKTEAQIHFDRKELVNFLVKSLIKTKKGFTYEINVPYSINLKIEYTKSFTKKQLLKRKQMLEKASQIQFLDAVEEFKLTSTKDTKRVISQFYNALGWLKNSHNQDYPLSDIIKNSKKDFLKFRGIGKVGIDLFEIWLKTKGFEFATWNGKEWL